jgi:hypothetical protein
MVVQEENLRHPTMRAGGLVAEPPVFTTRSDVPAAAPGGGGEWVESLLTLAARLKGGEYAAAKGQQPTGI